MKPLTKAFRNSVPLQILLAVSAGILLGWFFPNAQLKPFSEIGKLIIHWIKLIAGPFLFLTIIAAVVEVQIGLKHGIRVVSIAILNTGIAIGIGMGLAKLFLKNLQIPTLTPPLTNVKPTELSLSLSSWLKTLMPSSLFSPFVQNDVLLIALLALVTGLALRKIYSSEGEMPLKLLSKTCEHWRALPGTVLQWLINITPIAVLTVVAGSVSEHGLGVFASLFRYVAVVILGFTLQVILVYGTWIFLIARIKPQEFWKHAKAPILYAFGVNSSLATLPITLKALKDLGISSRSASLGAGVATNLNNDGIVLYEAMAVYLVAQFNHIDLTGTQMVSAALACIVASMGITGIPEAGFISLSVVISTLGLPAETLPLLLSVDWVIARLRSLVNVISDMTLSIALDVTD